MSICVEGECFILYYVNSTIQRLYHERIDMPVEYQIGCEDRDSSFPQSIALEGYTLIWGY